MSSLVRRIQRRIAEKINNADPERDLYRICQRTLGLTHRQAQRGVRTAPSAVKS